jgi:nitronate monooxygenase
MSMSHPQIIQGGMGTGVSDWKLARAVSTLGHLGVVSGTALDTVLARRLQLGDRGGHLRRAFRAFPFPEIARRVLEDYFIEGGKPAKRPFRRVPSFSARPPRALTELTILANFTEVYLARLGHRGPIGVNFLEKIQLPALPSLYGAMLAGVDYVLMGAGIPRSIPSILDAFARGHAAKLKLDVAGALPGEEFFLEFAPRDFCDGRPLSRPHFLAIVSSVALATTLARKSKGKVDGFVVEGPSAGGHNAPPRGALQLNEKGEPLYGERDLPDLEKFRALGLPFWLAGSYGRPEKLDQALRQGATGIQVGTPFAFCEESGIDQNLKQETVEMSRSGCARVFTDPVASPTGFPLKILQLQGSISEPETQEKRTRICDLGYLRHAYRRPDGSLGYRCAGEPRASFQRKGGIAADTIGRQCVCNGLLATIGMGQIRGGESEPPLVTAGEDVRHISQFLRHGADSYCAAEVVARLESSAASNSPDRASA